MSCEACFQSVKGMQQAYQSVKTQATQWATENQKAVAIYKEGFEYYFLDAEIAINEGKLIIEIVTF